MAPCLETHPSINILQARRFAKAMKASLIFSSTSHSINVQKVCVRTLAISVILLTVPLDIQDCALQSFRPKVHHSRDRGCGRAITAVSVGGIVTNMKARRSPIFKHREGVREKTEDFGLDEATSEAYHGSGENV